MKIQHFDLRCKNLKITNSTVLTVHSEDVIILKHILKRKKNCPYKIFVLFNYPKNYEGLVAYYLKHKFFNYHSIQNEIKITSIWDILILLFNKNQFTSSLDLLRELESIDILLDIDLLKSDLYQIIEIMKRTIFEEGLFLQKRFDKKKKSLNDHCFEDYYSLRDYLSNILSNNNIRIESIQQYLTIFQSIMPQHNDSIEKKFFYISIYFFMLANYHRKNKNYTVSFNLLHRTVDLYFEYLRKSISLPTLSKNFLWDKYENLKTSGSPTYTFDTHSEYMIKKLNQSRNKLYLTHGLYSIRKDELDEMFIYIKQMIQSHIGYLWKNEIRKFDFTFKLKPLDLFMYEPSFNTYFKDITHILKPSR